MLSVHPVSTLLATPVESYAIQYNYNALKSSFMFSFLFGQGCHHIFRGQSWCDVES